MKPAPDLVVDSVTGVDVALPIAGPGARAYAFLIDWNIRTVLCIAWYVVAALAYNRSWNISAPLSPDAAWFAYVVVPPATIYFLYHAVLEIAMRGRTPGKRMAGLQIVGRDGGAPGIGALLVRNVFRLVDSFPVAYAVGLVATMLTREHVRIGDLAAGTLLVYARTEATLPRYVGEHTHGSQVDAVSTEIIGELLQRWSALDVEARRRIALALLANHGATAADDDLTLRVRLERLAAGEAS